MDFFTLVGLGVFCYFFIYAICLWLWDCNLELAFVEKFGKKLGKLRSKVIWITGASTDLGTMIALKVAKYDGRLVLSSSSEEDLIKIKALCLKINSNMTSSHILVLPFDVGTKEVHGPCFERVIKKFGTLDILILNEDKSYKELWENTNTEMERNVFRSNVFGVISLSRLAIKYFSSKRKGKLAIVSSIAGLIGVPFSSCYTGSKHALHGYYNSLKIEKLADNIQVTLLCPGSNDLSEENFMRRSEFLDFEVSRKKKMSARRCAHLCLIAIVNNLDEAWMAIFPTLPLIYGFKYYPNITKCLLQNYLKLRKVKN